MNYKIKTLFLNSLLFFSCSSIPESNSSIDKDLIIPGKRAEGYYLGQFLEKNESPVYLDKDNSISDILDIPLFSDLKFNSIIYINHTSVLFLKNGIVIAVAGIKIERRITSDAVLLSKGIDNFIINYGNSGLVTRINGNHKAYIYKKYGIAVFNDNNDANIDMYLVFKK